MQFEFADNENIFSKGSWLGVQYAVRLRQEINL